MISPFDLLRYATPTALGAVGETVLQRSGALNIGLEGVMLNGAFSATLVAAKTGNVWLGLTAGALVGLVSTLILAWLTNQLDLDQLVCGAVFNLLSLGLCGTAFERQSATGKLLNLPSVPPLFGKFDVITLLLIATATSVGYWLYRTDSGLKLRASGEYPATLTAAGFSPRTVRNRAWWFAGLLGGLGGAYLSLGVTQSFATEMVGGRGFIAITLVTFARWRPLGVVFGAILLAAFEAIQFQLQLQGAQVSKSLLLSLPYVATLIILIIVGKGTQAPKALGQPLEDH